MHLSILVIRPGVRSRIFTDPVLFLPGQACSAGYLARGPGALERAAFLAVAEGLKPVLLFGRIPVIDNDFDRHPAAPHKS
jgi:hypothetical protein